MTSAEESSTGLTPRVAAVLAYLAGPFSGVLVLLAERTSGYVRFHAWQSVLGLGALGLVVVMLLGLAFASLVVSARAFFVLYLVAGAGLGLVGGVLGDLYGAGVQRPAMEAAHRRRVRGTLQRR